MVCNYSDDQINALLTVLLEAIEDDDWDRFVWILGEEVHHNSPACMSGYSSGRSRLLENLAQGKDASLAKVAGVLDALGLTITVSRKTP